MTWRDSMRRVEVDGRMLIGASFRGVPFFVESSDRSGGRRLVVHEFPLRNIPYVEDMGRKARTFRLDAYVLGDDYVAQRDLLLTALESDDGPGTLVHPYHGQLRVACASYAVRESRDEGGIARLAIDFTEAPQSSPAPTVEADTAGQVASSASKARASSSADAAARVSYLGMPAFAVASAEIAVARASDALQAALSPLMRSTQELAQLASQCAMVKARAASLVRQPATLLASFRDAINAASDAALVTPGSVMRSLLAAYGADLGTPTVGVTSTRAREASNHSVIVRALKLEMLSEAARLAPDSGYESLEEATALRDQIAGLLEVHAQSASDDLYPSLVQLRSDVLRAIPGGRYLARVVDVQRAEPVPSLALAYDLYGSTAAEADMIARNAGRVTHPGFVSGTIKVLSDV